MERIHEAVNRLDLNEVVRLVEADPAVVSSTDNYGRLPLHLASFHGDVEIACYLLEQGAGLDTRCKPTGWTALYQACIMGHLGIVDLLLRRGANPTINSVLDDTPLMMAARYGHVEVVRCLLRERTVRATIDARDSNGWTALYYGSSEGHVEVVKSLAGAGANPMVATHNHRTPLLIAQEESHNALVELLEVGNWEGLLVSGSTARLL